MDVCTTRAAPVLAFFLGACGASSAPRPPPPDDLTNLLRADRVFVATEDGCVEWTLHLVNRSLDVPPSGAMRRQYTDEKGCQFIEKRDFERIAGGIKLSYATREGQCSDGTGVVGGALCGGPYDWKATSISRDAITLEMTRHKEIWFRDLRSCESRRRVALHSGC